MNEEQFDDDDVTWASPEIREKYESALGKFLLTFNQIDFTVLQLTETVLGRLGRIDLAKKISERDFSFRIYLLDVLKETEAGAGVKRVNFAALRQLASERALLAHAHMDQNPFDGSYKLISKGVDKGEGFTSERVIGLAKGADTIWEDLRYAEAYYEFDNLDIVDPPTNVSP